MNLTEFTLTDALASFPDISKLDIQKDLSTSHFDLCLMALGFEERTLSIAEKLAVLSEEKNFRCEEIIYFTYETSTNDNSFNEPLLLNSFKKIKNKKEEKTPYKNIMCDEDGFIDTLCNILNLKIIQSGGNNISVALDISVCSSRLILNLFKVFFKIEKIDLTILYTEALIYFPTYNEFITNKEAFLADSELSTTRGNEDIINSNEYSEGAKESTDLVVAFAPFKVGRINKIVSDIDESILLNNEKRLIWIVGDPNFEDNHERLNRIHMVREINEIAVSDGFEVSTLDYKSTLEKLEYIYDNNIDYHINIADLGSKMQSIGISLFYHIRPDVSVYYALPKKYNSSRYSQGIKSHWIINFGDFVKFITLISKIDTLDIEFNNPQQIPFYD